MKKIIALALQLKWNYKMWSTINGVEFYKQHKIKFKWQLCTNKTRTPRIYKYFCLLYLQNFIKYFTFFLNRRIESERRSKDTAAFPSSTNPQENNIYITNSGRSLSEYDTLDELMLREFSYMEFEEYYTEINNMFNFDSTSTS